MCVHIRGKELELKEKYKIWEIVTQYFWYYILSKEIFGFNAAKIKISKALCQNWAKYFSVYVECMSENKFWNRRL